jgi:hypothetical protein
MPPLCELVALDEVWCVTAARDESGRIAAELATGDRLNTTSEAAAAIEIVSADRCVLPQSLLITSCLPRVALVHTDLVLPGAIRADDIGVET